MQIDWKPTSDRVIVEVKKVQVEQKGILLADKGHGDDRTMEGTVLQVGKGRLVDGELIPVELNVGDKVLFNEHAGTDISVDADGEKHSGYQEGKNMTYIKIMIEDSILAIL